MVKVLLCHHFKSQIVFCPKSEPQHIALYDDQLFACTLVPEIEVYSIKDAAEKPKAVFDTTGQVITLVYFQKCNVVVTLEKLSQSRGSVVCLYHINSPSDHPVHCKLTISGVINPSCISGDRCSDNICVGSKEKIHLYHITHLAGSSKANTPCYSVECLVEVNVSFCVSSISLCEEYLLYCSTTEVQLVRLKVGDSASRKEDVTSHLIKDKATDDVDEGINYTSPYLDSITDSQGVTSVKERSSSQASNVSQRSLQSHLVTEDKYHITLRCQLEDSYGLKDNIGTKWLKSISEAYESQSEALHKDQVIIGPIQNHPRCAVFISHIAPHLICSIDRSMLTYLYRTFDSSEITHIQLMPIYNPGSDISASTDSHPIHSTSRHDMSIMLCYISTLTEGYLYSVVYDRTTLLQRYTYTTEMVQVYLTAHQLYVATVTGLEIYTVESTAKAVVRQHTNASNKLFPECNEPCMIGLQPFVSVDRIGQCSDHVTVLSKGVSRGESVWSIYVLQKPGAEDLLNDMMELAALHKSSSEGTYLYMLQQIFAYSWIYNYLNPEQESRARDQGVKSINQEVAFLLGQVFTGKENTDWKLCLPFFLQSQKAFNHVLTSCLTDNLPGKGFWNYIDYMLFQRRESLCLDKEHAHLVLTSITRWRPSLLSTVIVTSSLSGYDPAYACSCLEKCTRVGKRHSLMNILTTVTLQLQQGKTSTAEQALQQIPKDWLQKLCIKHSHMMFDQTSLTPLAKLLGQVDTDMLVEVMVQCIQQNGLDLQSVKALSPESYTQVLEQLACDNSNSHLFCDICTDLVQVYLERLIVESKVVQSHKKYIIPRRDGLFKDRARWLDNVYPLEGTEAMTKECRSQDDTSPCPCTACNADLLKLQCLLCSHHLPNNIAITTKNTAASNPKLQSVHMLCLQKTDVPTFIDMLIDRYPRLVGAVLKQSQDMEIAQKLAENAFNLQRNLEQTQQAKSTHKQLLKDLLSVLCEMMSPGDLFKLLPQDGNTRFFLPYVMRCLELQQSRVVKTDLQASVNKVLNT